MHSLRLLATLRLVSYSLPLLVLLVGIVVVGGWVLNIVTLKTVRPGLAAMTLLTAMSFILASVSMALRAAPSLRWLSIAFGTAVAAIGLTVLIDTGFFGGGHLNGMLTATLLGTGLLPPSASVAPATATNFILLGLSIALLDWPHRIARRLTVAATLAGLAISGIALVGYSYGVPALYAISPFSAMAVHTAACFFLLFAACLLAHPQRGWTRNLISTGAGGRLARLVVPLIIVLPAIAGSVLLGLVESGRLGTPFSFALMVVLTTLPLAALVCSYARVLDRLDLAQRWRVERQYRRNASLERQVARRTLALEAEMVRRITTERALLKVQKLEAVGSLGAGVAHALNNLLMTIGGSVELIRDHRNDDERCWRLVAGALMATGRCEGLVQQLLMLGRQQAMHPEVVDANRAIGDLKTLIEAVTQDNAKLLIHLDSGPALVRVDRNQFEATILNLATNAHDALHASGEILIETRTVNVGADDLADVPDLRPGPYIVIKVADNGRGIAPHVLPRVFDPFYTTKDVGKGSGLGLSQVYGFAMESRGHIELQSELRRGTTAKLYLPSSIYNTSIAA